MLSKQDILGVSYVLLNTVSGCGVVFVNKLVLTTLNFHFVYALMLVHTATSLVGLTLLSFAGLFERKCAPPLKVLPLAAAFVGYVLFWNLSLQMNPVGFYQLSKICVTPAVIAIEAAWFGKRPTSGELQAVGVLCLGVLLATVTDAQVLANAAGLCIAVAAVWCCAVYNIWVGSKTKALGLGSLQLMWLYAPQATALLVPLVAIFEPLGLRDPSPDTLAGYPYTWTSVLMIGLSAILGLLVSMSTFLVIGALSSVTYNVVGHLKTVIILAGGTLLFAEPLPPKKLAGVMLALGGIFWYSYQRITAAPPPPAAPAPAAAAPPPALAATLPTPKSSSQEAVLQPVEQPIDETQAAEAAPLLAAKR